LKDLDICVSSASFPTFAEGSSESCLPLHMLSSTGSYAGHSKHYVKLLDPVARADTFFQLVINPVGFRPHFSPSSLWAVVSGSAFEAFAVLIGPRCLALSPACSLGSGLLRSLLQYLRALLEWDLCVLFGVMHRHPYLAWVVGEPRSLWEAFCSHTSSLTLLTARTQSFVLLDRKPGLHLPRVQPYMFYNCAQARIREQEGRRHSFASPHETTAPPFLRATDAATCGPMGVGIPVVSQDQLMNAGVRGWQGQEKKIKEVISLWPLPAGDLAPPQAPCLSLFTSSLPCSQLSRLQRGKGHTHRCFDNPSNSCFLPQRGSYCEQLLCRVLSIWCAPSVQVTHLQLDGEYINFVVCILNVLASGASQAGRRTTPKVFAAS
jgi:hypothetical protein